MSDKQNDFLEYLEKKYPHLFAIYRKGGNEIWCSEGWNDLIDRCCAEVVQNDPTAQVVQIKEKFGGLRFYLDTNSQNLKSADIIERYTVESLKTCELCGSPGKVQKYTSSYIRAVCSNCLKT